MYRLLFYHIFFFLHSYQQQRLGRVSAVPHLVAFIGMVRPQLFTSRAIPALYFFSIPRPLTPAFGRLTWMLSLLFSPLYIIIRSSLHLQHYDLERLKSFTSVIRTSKIEQCCGSFRLLHIMYKERVVRRLGEQLRRTSLASLFISGKENYVNFEEDQHSCEKEKNH